jgi:hypothetical protein
MATITELPISHGDVSVNEEERTVVLAGEKFRELLEYVTYIEDLLSIAEFDLASERRFVETLIQLCFESIDSLRTLSEDKASALLEKSGRCLKLQIEQGALSDEQLKRFLDAFASCTRSSTGLAEEEYAES